MNYIYDMVQELIEKYSTRDPYELCDALGIMYRIADLGSLKGFFTLEKDKRLFQSPLNGYNRRRQETVQQKRRHVRYRVLIGRDNAYNEHHGNQRSVPDRHGC